MFSAGTRAGLEDAPAKVKKPGSVSAPPTVKGNGPMGVSSFTVRFVSVESVGGVLFVWATVRTPLTGLKLQINPGLSGGRLELVKELTLPTASNKLKLSPAASVPAR